ncbi:MAG: LAGLIDADG family homing endonuclease [Nitrososphaerota archaeon]
MQSFLRGFFDSEGSVKTCSAIYCYNTDIKILKYVQRLLKLLEIESIGPRLHAKKGTPSKLCVAKNDVYHLYVGGASRLKFYEHAGFTIQRKKQRLGEYLTRHGLLRDKPPKTPLNPFPLPTITVKTNEKRRT